MSDMLCNLNVCKRSGCPHLMFLPLRPPVVNMDIRDDALMEVEHEYDSALPGRGLNEATGGSLSLHFVTMEQDGFVPDNVTRAEMKTSSHIGQLPSGFQMPPVNSERLLSPAKRKTLGFSRGIQSDIGLMFCFYGSTVQYRVPTDCPYYMEMTVMRDDTGNNKDEARVDEPMQEVY